MRAKEGTSAVAMTALSEFVATTPTTIVLDGIKSLQADIFASQSVAYHGKDIGRGKYGDIADLTRLHLQRLSTIEGVKLVIFISQDQQISDNSMGGQNTTYREMAFEGQASRGIIPPMCDMVLPIFAASQLGDAFKPWKSAVDDGKLRDRFFALRPMLGYWAGARVGLMDEMTIQADFGRIWNKFYANKETNNG